MLFPTTIINQAFVNNTFDMRICFHVLLHYLFLLQLVLSAPATLKVPSEDEFYSIPNDLNAVKPGTVLRIRKTPHSLRSVYLPIKVKNSWQLLVRSTDSHGNATAIVTTVIEPFGADPSKLLSYQTAQDSSNLNCAPSYSFLYGASMDTITTQAEMYLIQIALSRGWYVVSPDYEGYRAAFTAGRQSGYATLDSIRAALNSSDITGIDADAKVALFGYSGGSLASGHAVELQPTYAKELKQHLIGACLGGLVTNITATAVGVEGTLFAGLTGSAIAGLSHEYPELKEVINHEVVGAKNASYMKGSEYCMLNSILHYAFQNFFTGPSRYIKSGYDVFSNKIVKAVIDDNTLALNNRSTLPEVPMMIFHGMKDTIVPVKENSVRVAREWCDRGVKSLELNLNNRTGHITEIIEGVPAGFAWLDMIFNGTKPAEGCNITLRESNLLYPGVDETVVDLLASAGESILGFDIGPNGENLANTSAIRKTATGMIQSAIRKAFPNHDTSSKS